MHNLQKWLELVPLYVPKFKLIKIYKHLQKWSLLNGYHGTCIYLFFHLNSIHYHHIINIYTIPNLYSYKYIFKHTILKHKR